LVCLGAILGHAGLSWSHLGAIWGCSGAILGASLAILGSSWAILGSCWPSWGYLGPSWGQLGHLGVPSWWIWRMSHAFWRSTAASEAAIAQIGESAIEIRFPFILLRFGGPGGRVEPDKRTEG
jgi:hypothetical protein